MCGVRVAFSHSQRVEMGVNSIGVDIKTVFEITEMSRFKLFHTGNA